MLNNTPLYGFVITNTISNQILHSLLILFEYFFCIFPNVLYSGKKIMNYKKVIEYSEFEKTFLIFRKIRDSLNIDLENQSTISSKYYLASLVIICIFLATYFLLVLFYKQKLFFDQAMKIVINIFNIIVFRYLSYFFIDILVCLCLSYFNYGDDNYKIAIGYVFLVLQILFCVAAYSCISFYAVYIKIENKDIIKSQMNYPFDSYSSGYELHLLLLKFIIAYESNNSIINNDYNTTATFILNVVIFLFSIYLIINLLFKNIFLNINLVLIYTNYSLNMIRKFIMGFNMCVAISSIIFESRITLMIQVVIAIISSFFGVFIALVIWLYIERPKIYDFRDEVSEEIVVYLMSKSFTLGTKTVKNDNLAFYETIMSIVQTNHIIYCKDPSTCVICAKIKDLTVSVYDKLYFLYKYNLKNKNAEKVAKNYQQYLIKLFYSKIRNKTYKFYKYYYFLLKNKRLKVPILIQNTICFLVMDTMELENESGNIFLKVLIDLSDYNTKITALLKRLKRFIEQNSNLKTSDELLEISKDFSDKQKRLLKILNDLEQNTANAKISNNNLKKLNAKALKDYTNKKNIQSASKYNIIVSRYIIETTLNYRYQKIMPLNIDNLEDYLSYHFSHDQMIIVSTTIDEFGRNTNFDLVKATGFLGVLNVKMFHDYFPKKYSQVGNKKMFKTVNSNVNNINGKFEYVIEKDKYTEHFRFDFELAKTIINEKIMIYGSYYCLYENIILLKVNTNINTFGINPGEIEIVSYSKGTAKLLLIPPAYIETYNEAKNQNLNLDNYFKHIQIHKSSTDPLYEVNCILQYEHLHKVFLFVYEIYDKLVEKGQKQVDDSIRELTKINDSFLKRIQKTVTVRFTKLFELTDNSYVYKVNFQFAKHSYKKNRATTSEKVKSTSSSELTDNETEQKENKELSISQGEQEVHKFGENYSSTNTNSMTDSTAKVSTSSQNSTLNKERNQATLLIKKETRKLSLVSRLIYLLNAFLVLLCFIFLYVQITQTSELKAVNTFFFDYKTLREYFSNLFVTITSTINLCETVDGTVENNGCSNLFLDYLDGLQKELDFNDYSVRDYIFYEVRVKTDIFKNYYSNFKKSLHNDGYQNFVSLLSREITFYYLQQTGDSISTLNMNITFEQELEMFVASLYILINTEGNGSYFEEPFYFYTFEGGSFDLSNFQGKRLTDIQKEVFKLLSNYVYYSYSFNEGEEIIKSKSEALRKNNLIFSIIFMVLLGVFNFIILLINSKNLSIASYLFKKLICSLIFRIENPILKAYLLKKTESLIFLSEMYTKNPAFLIQSIGNEQQIYNKQVLKKEAASHKNSIQFSDQLSEKDEEKKYIDSVAKSSYHTKVFTNQVMVPLYKRNIFFFVVYYVIFLALDISLLLIITSVFSYQNYVVTNYDFQIVLYKALSAIHLFRLINTTERSYGDCLNEEIGEEGIVNGYIQSTYNYFWGFNKNQEQKGYIKITDFYDNNCANLYEKINDEVFTDFSKKSGIQLSDNYAFQKKVCERFQFENFKSMNFVFIEFLTILQNLHNRYTVTTYEGLFEFCNDLYLKQSYLYMYYFIRPVKQNFDVYILTPEILSKFSFYVVFVWIYLTANIVMEIILFIFNKVFIVQQLDQIHEYFFLFVQCTE